MNEMLQRAMTFIKTMWANMTAGQRAGLVILSFLLLAVLSWVVAETSRDNLVPLVPVSESEETKAQIKKHLEQKNVFHKVQDGSIYVRASEKESAVLEMVSEGTLNDEAFRFLDSGDLSETNARFQKRWDIAVQRRMEKMIMGIDPVRKARVQITPSSERANIGFARPDAKAAVMLELKPGKMLSDQTVYGIARMISSAVQNLKPENVTVMDTQHGLYPIPDPNSGVFFATSTMLANVKRQKTLEEAVVKILAPVFLPHQGQVSVAAYHDYSFDTVHKEVTEAEPVEKETERTNIEDRTYGKGAPTEIKTAAQVSRELITEGMTSERKEKKDSARSSVHIKSYVRTDTPPGTQTKRATVSVVVALPKDKLQNPPMKEDVARKLVSTSSGIEVDEKSITVAYVELPPPVQIPEDPAAAAGFMVLAERYGGKALLGLLLLVSLVFAWRVVKNAAPRGVPVVEVKGMEAEAAIPLPKLPEQIAMDEMETKSAQMKAGVRELVQKNPRSVASMLKRWVIGH